MSTRYIPSREDFFYIECKPREVMIPRREGGIATAERVLIQDDSYGNAIFQCVARDSTAIIAKVLIPKPISAIISEVMFKINNYNFSPVGPEVIKHYNFLKENDES